MLHRVPQVQGEDLKVAMLHLADPVQKHLIPRERAMLHLADPVQKHLMPRKNAMLHRVSVMQDKDLKAQKHLVLGESMITG